MRDGIPGAYFGRELTPGVRGFVLGPLMILGVAPPGRTLWSNRQSPTYVGQLRRRADGASDLVLLASSALGYPKGDDPQADAFFEEWLRRLELNVEAG